MKRIYLIYQLRRDSCGICGKIKTIIGGGETVEGKRVALCLECGDNVREYLKKKEEEEINKIFEELSAQTR